MKIALEITDMDYSALVEYLLPIVRDRYKQNEDLGSKVLSTIASVPPSMVGKMVQMLPQDKKDEIAAALLDKNKDRLIQMIESYSKEKGISFRITQFEVE